MVNEFGSKGAHTPDVLDWICPKIRPLKWRKVNLSECITALKKERAVIGSIFLTDS